MFDSFPDWSSKISLRGALVGTAVLSFSAGVTFGKLLWSIQVGVTNKFEVVDGALLTLFAAGLAVRFCFLVMSRAHDAVGTTEPKA